MREETKDDFCKILKNTVNAMYTTNCCHQYKSGTQQVYSNIILQMFLQQSIHNQPLSTSIYSEHPMLQIHPKSTHLPRGATKIKSACP